MPDSREQGAGVDLACAVPLTERLRQVPKDARLFYDHSPTCTSVFPVGYLLREAADTIDQAATALQSRIEEVAMLREAVERAAENLERLMVPRIVGNDVHNFAYQAAKLARAALATPTQPGDQ